jgi:hypothetical protein
MKILVLKFLLAILLASTNSMQDSSDRVEGVKELFNILPELTELNNNRKDNADEPRLFLQSGKQLSFGNCKEKSTGIISDPSVCKASTTDDVYPSCCYAETSDKLGYCVTSSNSFPLQEKIDNIFNTYSNVSKVDCKLTVTQNTCGAKKPRNALDCHNAAEPNCCYIKTTDNKEFCIKSVFFNGNFIYNRSKSINEADIRERVMNIETIICPDDVIPTGALVPTKNECGESKGSDDKIDRLSCGYMGYSECCLITKPGEVQGYCVKRTENTEMIRANREKSLMKKYSGTAHCNPNNYYIGNLLQKNECGTERFPENQTDCTKDTSSKCCYVSGGYFNSRGSQICLKATDDIFMDKESAEYKILERVDARTIICGETILKPVAPEPSPEPPKPSPISEEPLPSNDSWDSLTTVQINYEKKIRDSNNNTVTTIRKRLNLTLESIYDD